jgi:hypothetical protein
MTKNKITEIVELLTEAQEDCTLSLTRGIPQQELVFAKLHKKLFTL